MESKGIMEQIREHIAQGKSSSDIIAMGYAPPTVYKVQRWMRKKGLTGGRPQIELAPVAPVTIADHVSQTRVKELEAENEQLRQQLSELHWEVIRADAAESKLAQARSCVQELETRVSALGRQAEQNRVEWRTLQGLLAQAKERMLTAESKLREVEQENADLKAYLGSKNCGWQEDFARFKEPRKVCAHTPVPSTRGIVPQSFIVVQRCTGHVDRV